MDERREKLIALLLGDLPGDDARDLEAKLATDADLQDQRRQLEGTLLAVRSIPAEDASESAVQSLLQAAAELELSVQELPGETLEPEVVGEVAAEPQGKVIRVNFLMRAVLPRVAAVALIVFILGVAVMFIPRVDMRTVPAYVDGAAVVDGSLVESRAGDTRTITFPTGEVLLDGASAVRVHSTGKYSPPRFEVERGRMVLTASGHAVNVAVAGNEVQVEQGGMLAVSYDRAYANIANDGSLVEIQRMPIEEVAVLAERAYGLKLDLSAIDASIKRKRVTFYGSGLSNDEFLDSFVEAARKHGVQFGADRNTLTYKTSSRVFPNEEWALEIAVLEGSAKMIGGKATVSLKPADFNLVSLNAEQPTRLETRTLEANELNDTVVWAAAAGHELGGRLKNVRPSDETLPGGTVIFSDSLVLNGDMGRRIFKLDGPDFDFPLPGGRKGRVVQLMGNGALFEVKGEVVREFVPFGQISKE